MNLGVANSTTFIDDLTAGMRKKNNKLAAILNGSCRVVSWQDGVLTLGFFQDAFHKKTVEESQNRRIYEEVATEILGSPVSIRCVVAPKPARATGSARTSRGTRRQPASRRQS